MKYLKKFNEGILDDVRSEVDKTRSSINSKFGRGTEVEDQFNDDSFEVSGKLEIQDGSSKTPVIKIRSMNKTIDGTSVLSGDVMVWDLTEFDGQEVTIKGTTKNGEKPSFMNPIRVNEIHQDDTFYGKISYELRYVGTKSEGYYAFLKEKGTNNVYKLILNDHHRHQYFKQFDNKQVIVSGELSVKGLWLYVEDIKIDN